MRWYGRLYNPHDILPTAKNILNCTAPWQIQRGVWRAQLKFLFPNLVRFAVALCASDLLSLVSCVLYFATIELWKGWQVLYTDKETVRSIRASSLNDWAYAVCIERLTVTKTNFAANIEKIFFKIFVPTKYSKHFLATNIDIQPQKWKNDSKPSFALKHPAIGELKAIHRSPTVHHKTTKVAMIGALIPSILMITHKALASAHAFMLATYYTLSSARTLRICLARMVSKSAACPWA